ncbi:hypothetical protein BJY24_000383 [Nocardia transvalensis]|uniref:Uncharacterized protein n=1 Tax=Nocardia transvalensis TaxID=37333 RepID=A0A7W9P8M3_9NOCA|nr:DUF308 domain-containing protein [Nocardia transvalensis]MBB5911516.1 hypothetical protein [Nocardia transvalensis]
MNYPQYQGGYHPYPYAPARGPGGGTAITAGVLASLGAAGQGLGGVMNIVLGATRSQDLSSMTDANWYVAYTIASGVIALIAAGLLAGGAVGLFRRKRSGRMPVVAGCATTLVIGIVSLLVAFEARTAGGAVAAVVLLSATIGMAFPIVTIVLTLVPATTRWLAADPAQPAAPQPYPAQQYPPQPYPGQPYPPQQVGGQQYPSAQSPAQQYPPAQSSGQSYSPQPYPGQSYPPHQAAGQQYPPQPFPGQSYAPEQVPGQSFSPEQSPGQQYSPQQAAGQPSLPQQGDGPLSSSQQAIGQSYPSQPRQAPVEPSLPQPIKPGAQAVSYPAGDATKVQPWGSQAGADSTPAGNPPQPVGGDAVWARPGQGEGGSGGSQAPAEKPVEER